MYASSCIIFSRLTFAQVTIVAHIVEVKKQATNTTYIVEDGTGRFEARHWNEQNSEDDDGQLNGIEYVT
jgi:replication factor A2